MCNKLHQIHRRSTGSIANNSYIIYTKVRNRQGMPFHVLAQESDHVSAAGVERNKWKADGPVLLTTASHTASHKAVSSQDAQGLALSRVRAAEGGQGGARNKSPPARKAAPGGSSRKKAGAEREAQWDSTVVVKGKEGKKEVERQLALQQGMARARAGGGRGADVFETTSDLWALEVSRDKQVCKR